MDVPQRTLVVMACGLAAGLLLGCQNDEIKHYQAPKEETRPAVAARGPRAEALPTCKAPESWKEIAPNPSGGEVQAFQVADGDKTAKVTIAAAGGSLLGNVNRWRTRQLGLAPVDEEQLQKERRDIDVDGKPAYYADLTGETPGKGPQRILGVIAERGGRQWFFKMMGQPDLVEKQKPAFEAFIKSVRFGGTGANDE
jgi:hypothetical protein